MQHGKLQCLLQEASTQLQAGRLEAAARFCMQARALAPGDFHVLNFSGVTALRQERYANAVGWLARAARLQPGIAACSRHLGFALAKLARHEEAEDALRAALELAPDNAETWDALGFVLKARGQLGEAIRAHRRAIELKPNRANSWYNLGQALVFAGRPAEALDCQDQALAADPAFPKVHYGRALALLQCHRIPEAIAAFGAALRAEPDNHTARSYRLMALNYLEDWPREALYAEHADYGNAVNKSVTPRFSQPPEAGRKLRLAFLSPDLREHSVAYFLEPLLAHLDPEQFKIFLYHDHFVVDGVSARLRGQAAVWRHLVGMSGEVVEAAIRADAVDVLVDLAGHTGLNRLPLFARRLAPVQISYLGYPNTTGLKAMDYRLVDAVTDPDTDSLHTEQLVRFAPTAWSYQPPGAAPACVVPPCTAGAPVTFGCFNNFAKVNDTTLRVWARLLEAVPGSRLLLKAAGLGEPAVASHVRERLQRAGLEPARVELIERTAGLAEHLALYARMDIALDTFPYNGTTTTCEALWMGRPVVTLAGDRHAARVGASLLTAVGRPAWIATSWDDYIRIAAELAQDPAQLAAQSSSLRDALRASPLHDHPAQAARFAAAIRSCWEKSCALAQAQ